MSHLDSAELIYANFSNGINEIPFAVFIDYNRQAVVITVRGTLSLEDCITDAMAHPESLEEAGKQWSFVGKKRFAHSGMLQSAIQIRETLRDVPCVNRLLNYVMGDHPTGGHVYRGTHHDFCPNIVTPLSEPIKINRLFIVGHSLGAGVASILGLLMKSEFSTLKVLVYGTPGSVFDRRTAGGEAPLRVCLLPSLSHLRCQYLYNKLCPG
jgi:sn1-specific diacylglycerol lipase